MIACPNPNAYTLALPRRMRCSPPVNADRLKPFFDRAGELPAPGPVSDVGQAGASEHEVELLLNRRTVRGVTRYLVRWRGYASSDDEWLRVEELSHSPEKVAEDDAAAPRRTGRRATRRAAANPPAAPPAARVPSPLAAPARFRLAAITEVLSGPAFVGRSVLFRWPAKSWVRGTVARRSRAADFSQVARHGPRSASGAAVVDSPLDAASHGPAGGWTLLFPARLG